MELQLDAHLITDKGLVRERNEDRCGAFTPADEATRLTRGRLFIVADGMGGHAGGDVAAEMTLQEVPRTYFQTDWYGPTENLQQAFVAANAAIAAHAAEDPVRRGMGAAAVAVAVIGNRAILCHMGDCRAYRIRETVVDRLTADHSWVQSRVEAGRITEEEATVHPYRNVLTRALGADGEAEPTVGDAEFLPGDTLLLCSDGLWGVMRDPELLDAFQDAEDSRAIARRLVDLALERGGPDNISVAVVRALAEQDANGASTVAPTQQMSLRSSELAKTQPIGLRSQQSS